MASARGGQLGGEGTEMGSLRLLLLLLFSFRLWMRMLEPG